MNINSFLKNLKTPSQLINYQTVRWRRPKKPFWLGIAKSKMFIVPEPKIVPTEEKVQNETLTENYQTQLKSLLEFVRNSDPKLEGEFFQKDFKEKIKYSSTLELEISRSFENNAAWNAESARRRDERIKESKEKYVETVLEKIDIEEKNKKKQMELIEEVVRKEKLLSKSYITSENIDEAIENCLNNVNVYDFAIDLKGNRYPGNESLTSHLHEDETKATPGAQSSTL